MQTLGAGRARGLVVAECACARLLPVKTIFAGAGHVLSESPVKILPRDAQGSKISPKRPESSEIGQALGRD